MFNAPGGVSISRRGLRQEERSAQHPRHGLSRHLRPVGLGVPPVTEQRECHPNYGIYVQGPVSSITPKPGTSSDTCERTSDGAPDEQAGDSPAAVGRKVTSFCRERV